MLTTRMQIQAIADRLAGLPAKASARHFKEPWLSCWLALERDGDNPQKSLAEALANNPEGKRIMERIMSARPGWSPSYPSLAELAEGLPPIEWLWPGWIPRGMLTLLGAAQGSGKSFLALDLAYRIISGSAFPDGSPVDRPGANVLYVDAEAVPQILNERAENYQINRRKLFVMLPNEGEMIDFGMEAYRDRFVEQVGYLAPELVIIDSLSSIHSKGQNNVEDVRELLGFLTQVAVGFRVGMLLIHHIRKPGGGQQGMLAFDLGMEDLSGSGHITAMARVVMGLHVVQTGQEFDPNGPRELKMLKTNLGPYEESLGFEFEKLHPRGVYLKWLREPPRPYERPTTRDECAEWLLDVLSEAGKPLTPAEIVEMGREAGFSRATIFRAREELGAKIVDTSGRKSPQNAWTVKPLAGDSPGSDNEE